MIAGLLNKAFIVGNLYLVLPSKLGLSRLEQSEM